MNQFKKHIAVLAVFVLLTPSIIQTVHAYEDHEHRVCKSVDEQHIHEDEIDCSELHILLSFNYHKFSDETSENKVYYLKDTFTNYKVKEKQHYYSKKSSRAPPVVQ